MILTTLAVASIISQVAAPHAGAPNISSPAISSPSALTPDPATALNRSLDTLLSGSPLSVILPLLLLSIIPFLLLATTSFVKLSVVFGILRNAIGAQQIPSAAISTLLAIVLTGFVMEPVGQEMFTQFQASLEASSQEKPSQPPAPDSAIKGKGGKSPKQSSGPSAKSPSEKPQTKGELSTAQLLKGMSAALGPLEEFLRQNSREEEREFFLSLRKAKAGDEAKDTVAKDTVASDQESIFTLVPSFLLSELQEAFVIGFRVFLPFLILDLLVGNILAAMGLTMISPTTISLPLKLLLFASVDGWLLLCRGLLGTYGIGAV